VQICPYIESKTPSTDHPNFSTGWINIIPAISYFHFISGRYHCPQYCLVIFFIQMHFFYGGHHVQSSNFMDIWYMACFTYSIFMFLVADVLLLIIILGGIMATYAGPWDLVTGRMRFYYLLSAMACATRHCSPPPFILSCLPRSRTFFCEKPSCPWQGNTSFRRRFPPSKTSGNGNFSGIFPT